nr:unnamed protein product [Callosobruchus analis]
MDGSEHEDSFTGTNSDIDKDYSPSSGSESCNRVNQAVDTWKEQKYQYYVQLNSHGLTVAFHQPKTIVYMSIVHVDGEEVSCTMNLLLTSTCCVVPSRQLDQGRTTELNHHST